MRGRDKSCGSPGLDLCASKSPFLQMLIVLGSAIHIHNKLVSDKNINDIDVRHVLVRYKQRVCGCVFPSLLVVRTSAGTVTHEYSTSLSLAKYFAINYLHGT